jgi:RHS repeat-associated protein
LFLGAANAMSATCTWDNFMVSAVGGTYLWAQQDADYNITALVNSSGAVVERYADLPYGSFTVFDASWNPRSSSAYNFVYQHQDLRYDQVSSVYIDRGRIYDASLGRFLQVDPKGFAAGDVDLYRAEGDAPVGGLDPNGLDGNLAGRLYGRFQNGWSNLMRGFEELPAATVRTGNVIAESVDNLYNGRVNPDFMRGIQMLRDDPVNNGWKVTQEGVQIITEPPRRLGEGIAEGDSQKIVSGFAETGLMYMGARQMGSRMAEMGPRELPLVQGGAAEGGIQYGTAGDLFLTNASRATPLEGVLDVVVHGTEATFEIGANTVNHRVLAGLIQRNPQFVGQPIRLVSCNGGSLPRGVAKNLANKLGVPVSAPNDVVWAWPDGTLTIGATPTANTGAWKWFTPGGGLP